MAKKLTRSTTDSRMGGVLGGLGNYFNVSSTLLRIIFLIIFFYNPLIFVIYLILMGILPTDRDVREEEFQKKYRPHPKGHGHIREAEKVEDDDHDWMDF